MFRPLPVSLVLVIAFGCASGPAATALSWPSSSTGTNIGGDLPDPFEPSGIVWDDFTGALWLVDDEGQLARMLNDGTNTDSWSTGLSLESVAVTGTTQKLYLGVEAPPAIHEYNSSSTGTPTSTNRSWSLGLPYSGNSGMEGLTWVPNGHHPYVNSSSGGVFFAGSQYDGTIYVYDVNLASSGSTPVLRGSFKPDAAQTDLSDLYYSPSTRTLFVLYDTANKLLEIDTSTTSFPIMSSYTLPSTTTGQEGVTLLPQCPGALTNIYIADDQGSVAHDVFLFNNFPQLCATVLSPTADATTSQAAPNTNQGTQASLTTDTAANADENFLIRFSLSGITTANIARAQLRLYATDGTDLSPQHCATPASWSETSVTWNNQPVCTGNNLGGGTTVANNSWTAWDLRSSLQGGATSFRFTPRSSNDFVANSRQASSNTPQLILWMSQ